MDVGFHTPFNRLKRNWMVVYPASISDTTDRAHNWSPDGDILTLITTHDGPMKVHLNKIKPAVDSLFNNLTTTITLLLPTKMGLPIEPKWDFQDTLKTPESFIDQSDFLAIISPLYTQFNTSMRSLNEPHHQIWSANGFQSKKFIAWLEQEQQALKIIFLILLFTGGGVSPRAFSISALQYRATTTNKRNLYLLHGALCFAWPKAKGNSQSSNNSSDSLYAYPPQLNWLLFIYLGIIRRFTIEVLEEVKWSLGEMENKLFVNTKATSGRGVPWQAAYMNTILGEFSETVFDSRSRVPDLHQLTQSIYSLHFQGNQEKEGVMEAAANLMGNHTKGVAHRYYGQSNLPTEEWSRICFACSKAWHCWLGLVPYNNSITSSLGDLPILQRSRNQALANLSASNWIKDHREQILQVTEVRELLKKLLSKVRLNLYSLCKVLMPFPTREHQNMCYSVRSLHPYFGVQEVYHS